MPDQNAPSCATGAEKHDQIRKNLEQQLKFERLLADIFARFVGVPWDHLDNEIKDAQRQICECLGVDLCALWQLSADHPGSLLMTHIYAPSDFKPLPEIMDARETFPWCLEKLFQKEVLVLPQVADTPSSAARDREFWKYLEIESAVVFPLTSGGGPTFGALNFCVLRKSRLWESDLVNRLQLVAQIFASALARKITETALRESEARLTLAADSASAGLWSWDFKTGKIWATDKIRRLYGWLPDEEVTGDKFFNILHPDDRQPVSLIVERIFREGGAFQTRYRIVLPDKSIRWMAVRAQGFLNPSGGPDRMMGVSIDITQQVKNETDLSELRSELAHLTRVMTMNELSTSLAHEINQPLGAILNNSSAAQLLMARFKDEHGDIDEILSDITQDAKRAGDVVRKIRGIVKKDAAHFESVDMNSLIEEVIALFQNSISLHRVSLLMELEPALSKIRGDRVHLQQVLMNLIANALEAMRESPSRLLTLRSAMSSPDAVLVSVSDSGAGIEDAKKAKVFEPFFTTKKDGLGMGLRICRSIMEEHDGKIWVENNPAGGAKFSVSLTAWREPSP